MSKQRRIKKLVKGHLNSKGADGEPIYTTAQQKIDRLAVLDDIAQTNATQLLEALTGTTGGDADGVAFAADAFPFDARESRDTDNDGIGDNRDILLEKIKADAIFVKTINGEDQAANAGTLEVAAAKLQTVATAIAAIADGVDDIATKRVNLVNLQADTDYTADGIAALLATVRQGRTDYLALKANVDAMTATADVTIDVAAPYNNEGDSAHTAADMATDALLIGTEGVDGRADDAKVANDAAVEDLGEIGVAP